ncbi:MAG: Phage- or plasmid-associated DNA primase [Verrucomicrobia bacterium]|nr:MAG: Phage- or plasmid-associated DNA primase [Verrucomicrobiota bacterium]
MDGSSSPQCGGAGANHGSTPEQDALQSGSTPLSEGGIFEIPAAINEWDRLAASRFYLQQLNWAVHHLSAPDRGQPHERGKKPVSKGWKEHQAADVELQDLKEVFATGTSFNLGVVVRPPFVAVDLDSKPDQGDSVRAWLAERPELTAVPRERTGGGAHLHFLCPDLPEAVLKARRPLTAQLTPKVTAELYSNGHNLVLAPSIHRSGHRYIWEVTGPIPEVSWALLVEWFGFGLPERKTGRKEKRPDWKAEYQGDVHTLDILALFRQAGRLGDCLDPDSEKWAVRCLWEAEHSTEPQAEPGSDTVIFAGKPPGFKCLHAHCDGRSLADVCQWFEARTKGVIDRHCTRLRSNLVEKSVESSQPVSAWGTGPENPNQWLLRRHGRPFETMEDRNTGETVVVDFNFHYWAGRFAFENLVIYEPSSHQFYAYEEELGLWRWITEASLRQRIAIYLLKQSRDFNNAILELRRKQDRLASMVTVIEAETERRNAFRRDGRVIHLANGMLHLDVDPPELRSFSPHYFSLHQCPVPFAAEAVCPWFLGDLVLSSMSPEDADLLQLMGGLYLTGRNSWQKMLILAGTGGAGKGTIARVIQGLVGMQNVKQLRTRLLDDRFELDNLEQASLLVGSDVDGDFLSCRGAKVIKALTGGDPLTMETKGGRKRDILGEHNVLITCNDRLRVKLDGDESAWKRRLLLIEFDRSAGRQIDDFDRLLLEEEGSGILNWFLVGALKLRRLSETGGRFPVSAAQEDRIDALLAESDSLRLFVKRKVRRQEDASLTTEEILVAYENFCSNQNWTALQKHRFEQQLGPLMMEFHRAGKRNDISRGSSIKRGFKHVSLLDEGGLADSEVEPLFAPR